MNKLVTKYKTIKVPNVKYKSVLTKYRNIQKRNEVFNALDDETKRREIAFDALKLLLNETIAPAGANNTHRHYMNQYLYNEMQESVNSEELQSKFISLIPKQECTVCAKGGLMLSQIRLGNSLCVKNGVSAEDIAMGRADTLKGFDYKTFEDIEKSYEVHGRNFYSARTTEALMNIFCNIIINGNFYPDTIDYLIEKKIRIK